MTDAKDSDLSRIYEDLAEDGRLDAPPTSPTRLLDLEPEEDAEDGSDAAPRIAGSDSVDQSVDTLDGPGMEEVYDELGEGSIRLPGTDYDADPPDADDESWISTDQLLT